MTRRAFTLVELLVVLSIIALLISLLSPSLASARESARLGGCLSNVRQVGTAIALYFNDHDETVPFFSLPSGGLAAFSYGGKATSRYWRGGAWGLTLADRPLNQYLYPLLVDTEEGSVRDEDRIELPLYRCPSDSRCYQRSEGDEAANVSAYDDVGTSFMFNMIYIPTQTSGSGEERATQARRLMRRMAGERSSRFIVAMEDAASMGLWNRVPTMGAHGRFSRHTILMLDGHGLNLDMDTTHPIGPNWTAVDDGSRPFG